MAKNLFVGNLPYSVNDDSLRAHFEQVGEVSSAQVLMEKHNPTRSRGFGFVEMAKEEDAQKAIDELNGKDFEGRAISVDFARPREDRKPV